MTERSGYSRNLLTISRPEGSVNFYTFRRFDCCLSDIQTPLAELVARAFLTTPAPPPFLDKVSEIKTLSPNLVLPEVQERVAGFCS
jgi:hypothetical protein